jgi:hypothetical protein
MSDVVHHEPHGTGEIRFIDPAAMGARVISQRTSESAGVAFVRNGLFDLLLDRVNVHVLPPTDRVATRRVGIAAGLACLVPRAVG